jgi:hypothetical protein
MPLNEVLRSCYLVIDQLALLTVDFPANFGVLPPPPPLTFQSLRTTKYNFLVL